MNTLDLLGRIAEVEFGEIVRQTNFLGAKLRILLTDASYIDVWVSRTLSNRFGFHWERRHLDNTIYRYDNFPDVNWSDVPSFPYHFHDGHQDTVIDAPFSRDIEQGFRDFMTFVQRQMMK